MNLPAAQEMWVWALGQEDSPGEGNGNWPQYSCLENPMDRGVWQATVHGLAESDSTEWLNHHHQGMTWGWQVEKLGADINQHCGDGVGEADSPRDNGATEVLFHRCSLTVRGASRHAEMQRWSPRPENADHTAQGWKQAGMQRAKTAVGGLF